MNVNKPQKSKFPAALVALGLLVIGTFLLMNHHTTSGGWCIAGGILIGLDLD
jgi:hypothetical protein